MYNVYLFRYPIPLSLEQTSAARESILLILSLLHKNILCALIKTQHEEKISNNIITWFYTLFIFHHVILFLDCNKLICL